MLMGLVGFIKYLKDRTVHFEPIPYHFILLGVYALFALVSTIYSIDQKFTLIRSATLIPLFGFLLGLSRWLRGREHIDKLLNIVFWAVCFCLLINIIVIPLLPGRVWWITDPSRYMGLWGQPNQMGGFCMVSYPIFYWKISNSNTSTKWFLAFLILCMAGLHVLTGSRTTLIASALGTFIWLFVLRKPVKVVLMIGIMTFLVILALTLRPSNLTREGGFDSISTFTGRTQIWAAAAILARERPLVGYGYGVGGKIFEDPRFYNPKLEFWSGTARLSLHNGYLSSVISLGLSGALLLYFLLILPFYRCRKDIEDQYKALMLTVLFMAFLSNFLESVIGGTSGLISLVLWMLWVIAGKIPVIDKEKISCAYQQAL
jgi:O-antigen ligase